MAAALYAKAETEKWGLKQWREASSSKAEVSRWRRLITWLFGEEGGVFKFNRAGDALYVISSLGRWVVVAGFGFQGLGFSSLAAARQTFASGAG
mgnify:CR=1 FL=1